MTIKLAYFSLLLAALALMLPGCASRASLAEDSGRSYRMIFHTQAKKRSTMKVAALTATEAKLILQDYLGNARGQRRGRNATRSSGTARRRQLSRMGGVRRHD